MQDKIQQQILNALLIALRPITRALLRAGIGYREFSEISKTAFVEVSSKDYGLRGRPTNISRVAVMTGLTRKEVRRLRDKTTSGEETVVRRPTPMADILHRWYTESEFLADSGAPLELSFDSDEPSFASLVRKFGGDIPPGAMRTELKRIAAIEEQPDGRLKVLKRNVSGRDVHNRLINGLSKVIYPAGLALANNTKEDDVSKPWVMRVAASENVRDTDVSRFRRISSDRLSEFVESIDDLFAAYETLYDDESKEPERGAIGVGVFYFEENDSELHFFR